MISNDDLLWLINMLKINCYSYHILIIFTNSQGSISHIVLHYHVSPVIVIIKYSHNHQDSLSVHFYHWYCLVVYIQANKGSDVSNHTVLRCLEEWCVPILQPLIQVTCHLQSLDLTRNDGRKSPHAGQETDLQNFRCPYVYIYIYI